MNMRSLENTKIKTLVVMILLITVWGTSVTSVLKAEENKPTIRAEWKDKSTGSTYYNWNSIENDQYLNKVIVSTSDGKWARLDDKFTSIYMGWRETSNPRLSNHYGSVSDGGLFYYLPLYLDTTQMVAVRGNLYDISPDGNWGIYETNNFGAQKSTDGKTVQSTSLHSYFLKNMKTGELQEWMSSSKYVSLYWLADSTLLVNQYSYIAKQKAISTFNPATGKKKELVLGKIYGYSEKDQKFEFVRNEPKRLPWIYDLQTGESSLITKSEEEKFFSWKDPRPTSKAPDNIDMTTLPVIDLPIRNSYEHEVITSKGSELVPYTFVKEAKTYIPLLPILPKFNLSVGQREGNMYDYQYKLTGASGQSVTLDRSNSIVFQFRLFVTPEILEKVGLQDVTVRTGMTAVIK
jgi:hypothetical protein